MTSIELPRPECRRRRRASRPGRRRGGAGVLVPLSGPPAGGLPAAAGDRGADVSATRFAGGAAAGRDGPGGDGRPAGLGRGSGDPDGVGPERHAALVGGVPGGGAAEEVDGVGAGRQGAAPQDDVEAVRGGGPLGAAAEMRLYADGAADGAILRVVDLDLVAWEAVGAAGVEQEAGGARGERHDRLGRLPGAALHLLDGTDLR